MVLLWLVPPIVVTVAAMLWVSWLGREGRGEVDREVALRRLGAVLDGRRRGVLRRRPAVQGYAAPQAPRDRSSGVAIRRPDRAPDRPATTSSQASVEERRRAS
ncbi:hypothetical protein [Nocardioides sp. GXZ039]|uniref:hypothetical protein n=1 Tax=Nocardioides sp. GXZ039 TaxID=3136018 RepID=UPI0030F42785